MRLWPKVPQITQPTNQPTNIPIWCSCVSAHHICFGHLYHLLIKDKAIAHIKAYVLTHPLNTLNLLKNVPILACRMCDSG